METKILQINNEPEIEIISLNTICRLCANQSERLMGIFSEEGVSNDLFNKINSYLPIQVTVSDDLPKQCCWNCTTTLLAWHELVITSTEVDKKFRNSEIVSHKLGHETGNADSSMGDGDNDACDNEEIESKASTNLHDFSPPKPLKSARKRKKEEESCVLQEPQSMDPYITGMESEMIVPELVPPESDESDEDKDIKNQESEEEAPYVGCEYCSALFFSNESLTAHLREWHPEESKKLEKQKLVPKIEANIKKEKRKHCKLDPVAINAAKVVVDGKIYYNCRECGKNLHSPYTYSWHIRIHTGERPYVCDLCGKQFRVSQGLVRHLRETHEGIKKFPCDLCGRMFATRRNVEEHRRIHTNERPYVCDLCGKSFKQKASLFVHKRSHKEDFPFKCSYCEMGFRTKPPLMVHITRHTGEKPFKCDICGRGFRIKYELKRHRLIHSDAKPWVCNVCGVSFRQKRYLKNHVKSNHAVI